MCSSVENLVSPKRRFELESRQGKHHLSREHFSLKWFEGEGCMWNVCTCCLFVAWVFCLTVFFLPFILLLLNPFENTNRKITLWFSFLDKFFSKNLIFFLLTVNNLGVKIVCVLSRRLFTLNAEQGLALLCLGTAKGRNWCLLAAGCEVCRLRWPPPQQQAHRWLPAVPACTKRLCSALPRNVCHRFEIASGITSGKCL